MLEVEGLARLELLSSTVEPGPVELVASYLEPGWPSRCLNVSKVLNHSFYYSEAFAVLAVVLWNGFLQVAI